MNLNNLIQNLGFKGNLAGDMSFLILFVLVSVVLSFALGKHRILVSLLGVYASYVVVSFSSFDFTKDPNNKTLFFLALLIGFVIFFSPIVRGSISGAGPAFFAKLVIGTAIVVGLSLSVILGWYSSKELSGIVTPSTRAYFTDSLYKFIWGIAPLIYLGVVRKRMD